MPMSAEPSELYTYIYSSLAEPTSSFYMFPVEKVDTEQVSGRKLHYTKHAKVKGTGPG